jgi:hypothetical protein
MKHPAVLGLLALVACDVPDASRLADTSHDGGVPALADAATDGSPAPVADASGLPADASGTSADASPLLPDAATDAAPEALADAGPAILPDAAVDLGCSIDTDCAAHEVCDDGVTPGACVCAAGYALNGGGACGWLGVVADPGFTQANIWTATGQFCRLTPARADAGLIDLGSGDFYEDPEGDPLCLDFPPPRIGQTIVMPRRSRAEPLVAEAHYRDPDGAKLAFGIGPAWHAVPPSAAVPAQYGTARSCLGAAAYAPESSTGRGVPLSFRLGLANPASCQKDLQVDRIDLVPATNGECPAPGTALNGDAEGAGGWSFEASTGSSAAFAAGAGAGGSRGIALHKEKRCDVVGATTQVSIPLDVASPALSFHASNISGGLTAYLAGDLIETRAGDADGAMVTACIPASHRGTVILFQARMDNLDSGGTCDDYVGFDAVVDEVRIVDEPGCGTDPVVTNPGFEATTALVGSHPANTLIRDASRAHSGEQVLRMSKTTTCTNDFWRTSLLAPPASPGAGPAVAFYYRIPSTTVENLLCSSCTASLVKDGVWHRAVSCLDPRFPDRLQIFNLRLRSSGGTCSPVTGSAEAYVDDLSVTTDPACRSM